MDYDSCVSLAGKCKTLDRILPYFVLIAVVILVVVFAPVLVSGFGWILTGGIFFVLILVPLLIYEIVKIYLDRQIKDVTSPPYNE